MELDEVRSGLAVLYILNCLAATAPALYLERRRRLRAPGTRPYAWGYLQGVAALVFGAELILCALFLLLRNGAGENAAGLVLIFWLLAAAFLLSGWFMIQRRSLAWWIPTILTSNPILWIAHALYVHNRKSEFHQECEFRLRHE